MKRKMKHGESKTKLYKTWISMKRRCSVKHLQNYKYYGGRGVSVCDEWNEFIVFRDWCFNNGYKEGLQIDRIDNNGNYEPSNCRFVTPTVNIRNSSVVKLDTYKAMCIRKFKRDKLYKVKDMAIMYGVTKRAIYGVISGRTWN